MHNITQIPNITIALPLYNGSATIKAAIASIVQQTYQSWELLILDDGSSDDGVKIAYSFNDNRIKVYEDSVNKGISYRLNQAIDLARGRFWARMDADDIAFPERLDRQITYLMNHPDVDLVATRVVVFDNDGNTKGLMTIKTAHNEICCRPWNGFYMPHPTWFGRVEWFKKHRYRTLADKAEDQDLLFRSYLTSKFACMSDVLLGYRQDTRILNKLFLARRVLAYSFFETAIQRGQYIIIIRLIFITTLKVIADILNAKFYLKSMRNMLDALPEDLLLQWQQVWKDVHDLCLDRNFK